jgi:phosphate/sulfate permease
MITEPEQRPEDDFSLLRTVEQFNLFLVLLVALCGWYLAGWHFAQSLLIGGTLSGGSFFVLKRTMIQIVNKIGTQRPASGFAIKFYLRLLVLVLALAALSMSVNIHIVGLVAGLSTVMVSVIVVALTRGLMEFLGKHAKGA